MKSLANILRYQFTIFFLGSSIIILSFGCENNESNSNQEAVFFQEFDSRSFKMGVSSWPYAPTLDAVDDTYQFINSTTDIYSEHIDAQIPWNAWMNDLSLPNEFIENIDSRVSRINPNKELTVSVSLLNGLRNDLATDYDGTIPTYISFEDQAIEDAYFKHLEYITNRLNPNYLILSIEVNELLLSVPDKWNGYKALMSKIRIRIKERFPTLLISESITLHNLFQPDVINPDLYVTEIVNYINMLDFVAISFYPFFKGLQNEQQFQEGFDFLHQKITKPIAFAETGHISEDLSVSTFDLFITGNQNEQKQYLETLLTNAQLKNYIYVIWWTHRDYNELWETFPEADKDLGKLWLSNGFINEDGIEKKAFSSWKAAFDK